MSLCIDVVATLRLTIDSNPAQVLSGGTERSQLFFGHCPVIASPLWHGSQERTLVR